MTYKKLTWKIFWQEMFHLYLLICLVISAAIVIDTSIDYGKAYPQGEMLDVNIYYNNYGEYRLEFVLILFAIPGIIINVYRKVLKLDSLRDKQ